MSDDLIPMGSDLGGDFSAPSAPDPAPDTATGGDDHGLSGLTSALGHEQAPAEPAARYSPTQQQGQQSQGGFNRREAYGKAQRTWQSRQKARNEELAQLREERDGWKRQLQEFATAAQGFVAAQQPQQQQEEVPDPVLDPAGFQQWMAKHNASIVGEQMKPLMEHFGAIKAQMDAAQQRETQAFEQQRLVQETTGMLQSAHRAYEEQFPELAQGAEDRISSGLETLSRVFESGLGWGQDGAAMAQKVTLAVAQYAIAGGENPAAAVDAFYTGLIQEVADGLREYYGGMGYELPPFFMQGGAPGDPTYQPAPPTPAARENARLQQVRQRSQSVGTARPRQPVRSNGNQPTSRAAALAADYRHAGAPVDWNAVNRLALQEAGGNKAMALQIVRAIPAG